MRLICPSCGAIASAEAWLNDAEARTFLAAALNLPAELQKCALGYIGLFRPESRALSWKKANKLLIEFASLTARPTINWERKGEKPIDAALWRKAVEAVIERRPTQLKNHNYLKHTAYDFATKHKPSESTTYQKVSSDVPGVEKVAAPQKDIPPAYSEEQRVNGLVHIQEILGSLGKKKPASNDRNPAESKRQQALKKLAKHNQK